MTGMRAMIEYCRKGDLVNFGEKKEKGRKNAPFPSPTSVLDPLGRKQCSTRR